MKTSCGCCKGIAPLTPMTERNRPGLESLAYRIGTYATFFETMKAGLSDADLSALAALKTRDTDDPAIALLDAWSLVADVLTFYQERIANEGYLRTATERRSILELAGLVGYTLRPGVASTAYLAYTLDQNSEVTIAVGSRAQSVPGPGELPQSFETADPLAARDAWNNLGPRQVQPQIITPDEPEIYIAGTNANLKPNDFVLLDAGSGQTPRKVAAADTDFAKNRTHVTLQDSKQDPKKISVMMSKVAANSGVSSPFDRMVGSVAPLTKPPADHPRNALQLPRSIPDLFAPQADTIPSLLTTFHPEMDGKIYTALKNAAVTPDPAVNVYAFRVQASPFGNNAPPKPILDNQGKAIGTEEWPLVGSTEIVIAVNAGMLEGSFRDFKPLTNIAEDASFISISIKQGSVSATAMFSSSGLTNPVKLGNWLVDVTVPAGNAGDYIFTFRKPLARVFKITTQASGLSVAADGAALMQCPAGQVTISSDDGHRTVVAVGPNGRSFAVDDQKAISPDANVILLDSTYDQILPKSWAIVEQPSRETTVTQVLKVEKVSASNYGMSAKVTRLTLAKPWLHPDTDLTLAIARETTIYVQSEKLSLADEPINEVVSGARIELNDLYAGLLPGRWLIVQGERTDISGVTAAELVMLSGVEQDVQTVTAAAAPGSAADSGAASPPDAAAGSGGSATPASRPGDKTHSFLVLAKELAYPYKRDTVNIYGNVVRATHGEGRAEVLGSGDAGQELQAFPLHQSPLTYVATTTPNGTQSTLQVRVNEVLWHEVDTLADLAPDDRNYVTRTDEAGKTTVIFGNGKHGARLPSGSGNVSAAYRNGIGSPGNVAAEQISLLATRPLGVRSVINPLPATGGADKDTRDQARRNAPLGVTALDRLVSVQDYSDFARTFAGIAKASAVQLSDGRRRLVHLTIAGNADIPIAPESDLYKNLLLALQTLGDPHLAVKVEARELLLLVISARIQVKADYKWELVEPEVRARMLDVFGFDQRDLGEDVRRSEVIRSLQQVRGVNYVDLEVLDSISEKVARPAANGKDAGNDLRSKLADLGANSLATRIPVHLAESDPNSHAPRPAQLAYLSPKVPDTLILTEIPQ